MKNYHSLTHLLEIYKFKMETDGYVMYNYLCNCGEINTVMFLYDQDAAKHTTNNGYHITIIDKNNRYLNCNKCGDKTDLFKMYLAIAGEKGYTIQNIDEIKLMN